METENCGFCRSKLSESAYHPGTCINCGGPFGEARKLNGIKTYAHVKHTEGETGFVRYMQWRSIAEREEEIRNAIYHRDARALMAITREDRSKIEKDVRDAVAQVIGGAG